MRLLSTALLASVVLCNELKLQLRNIGTGATIPWGLYNYDGVNASTLEPASEQMKDEGPHCVDAVDDGEFIPCFSFLTIENPLHYNLVIDIYDQQLKKLSLIHNPEVTGVEPYIRSPVQRPEPPAVKLKKTTKTYQDKKADKEATTAQFSSEDNEEDNRTWFQKNWKVLLIGLIMYNVVSVMNKQGESQQEAQQAQKPLID